MNTLRAALVAAAGMIATLSAVHAEIRVISPYGEHVYSSDPRSGGQLLDDEALQQRNERAERARIAREQEEAADQAASSESQSPNTYQPPKSGWDSPNYQPPTSAWDSPNYQPPKSGWADR
jgi:hypothetical protein